MEASMPRKSRLFIALVAALLPLLAFGAQTTAPRKTLKPFADEQELATLLNGWAEEYRKRQESRRAYAPSAPQMALGAAAKPEAAADAITNVQHAGVDEGGIVKLHGEHLVILRRGRLFTVSVSDLRPVSAIDAYGP